jgi:PAS domain-containing protein
MEQLTAQILERSSDAIVIIRLADRVLLGANEAFFAVTGRPQDELVGRDANDLFVPLGSVGGSSAADGMEESWVLPDAPTGLWTRAGELRHGYLSALVLHSDGQRDAVCTIRDIRDPTPDERRRAARERFTRTVAAGGPRLEVATRAIRALGESLRWELGALWLVTPEAQALRCVSVWRSPLADLQLLEEMSWRTACEPGVGLVGRCWRGGHAAWVTDARAQPDLDPRLPAEWVGGQVHGWFGFPVKAGDDEVIGIVEFFSREVRQPDEELLKTTEEFGRLIGLLLENAEGRAEPPGRSVASGAEAGRLGDEELPGETVSSALRHLGQVVATVAGAIERQRDGRSTQDPAGLLRELAARIGKLDRLLTGAVESHHEGHLEWGGPAVHAPTTTELPLPIPTGLTLKAVSRRTGIPAATLRTWERRYGFVHPSRSASGYRLYGEKEIARVLKVKYLLEQGVRIGEAMAMVRGAPHDPQTG